LLHQVGTSRQFSLTDFSNIFVCA